MVKRIIRVKGNKPKEPVVKPEVEERLRNAALEEAIAKDKAAQKERLLRTADQALRDLNIIPTGPIEAEEQPSVIDAALERFERAASNNQRSAAVIPDISGEEMFDRIFGRNVEQADTEAHHVPRMARLNITDFNRYVFHSQNGFVIREAQQWLRSIVQSRANVPVERALLQDNITGEPLYIVRPPNTRLGIYIRRLDFTYI